MLCVYLFDSILLNSSIVLFTYLPTDKTRRGSTINLSIYGMRRHNTSSIMK